MVGSLQSAATLRWPSGACEVVVYSESTGNMQGAANIQVTAAPYGHASAQAPGSLGLARLPRCGTSALNRIPLPGLALT
jgi:hypothetical protein